MVDEAYKCRFLEISKVFFEYLIHSARAQSDNYIRDDMSEMWSEKEIKNFYERNKNNRFLKLKTVVSLPQQLIYPDEQKSSWKQTDLLREINRQLFKNYNSNTKGE